MTSARALVFGRPRNAICVALAIVMAVLPSLQVVAQTPSRPNAAQAQPPGGAVGAIDTTYVTSTAVGMLDVRPAQVLKSPLADLLPVEVVSAAGLKYLGFDPANVDEATAFVDQINPQAPPAYGIAIKFSQPIRAAGLLPQLRVGTQAAEVAGARYLQNQNPMLPSLWKADEKTIVLGSDGVVRQFIEKSNVTKSSPLIDRISKVPGGSDLYVVFDVKSVRPLLQMGLMQAAAEVPPEARPLLQAPNLISSAELTLNLSKAGASGLVIQCNDEADAQRLESLALDGLKLFQANMKRELAKQATSSDPVEQAMAKYTERVSGRWVQPFVPVRSGTQLTFFHTQNTDPTGKTQLTTIAIIGVLVALLLPAVQAAREAARRNVSMNNLKQLILGLQNYHDTKKTFPANAIYSSDGKPLLSWRVAILPFLEEGGLYKQFHLDEPWDSEHNRALIAHMPTMFQNPSQDLPPGKTTYLAAVGSDCIFNGTDKRISLRDITDGSSNTIMLVEANKELAVDWTKPDDWTYDAKNPKSGLGMAHPGGWLAAFADGHIQFMPNTTDDSKLKALFTRAGSEAVHP
ncbi:MAG TPA: DUF1559 domain-containing protein [Lacipirellulaceae bacterium]|jgi:hypothetical protein|nr:DUF1559 domain-containing protein [Lacipirellulaceae bacterium]